MSCKIKCVCITILYVCVTRWNRNLNPHFFLYKTNEFEDDITTKILEFVDSKS